jgi:acetyl-CoA carboxylase biotin carboxyl carrier protein
MDLDHIKQILDLVREHELAEFELEHDGLRIKIRRDANGTPVVSLPTPASVGVATLPPASPMPASPGSGTVAAAEPADEIELAVVKSPIVGTFYRSPEPGASSFVEVGSSVKKGDVLCIIEAMKLMNEIDSEYDGEVANIYVENGQAVQ